MPLSGVSLPDNPSLESILNQIIAEINGLTDSNVSASAGISPSKIGFTYDIDVHASRHQSGGDDPIPSDGLTTTMHVDRFVTSSKLGLKAVLSEHLADGAVAGNLDFASAGTAVHGSTIAAPTDYDIDKCCCIVEGWEIPYSLYDQVRLGISAYVTKGAAGFTVTCQCLGYSGSGSNTTVTGSIHYRLLAFK